jgi:hypothetical protein
VEASLGEALPASLCGIATRNDDATVPTDRTDSGSLNPASLVETAAASWLGPASANGFTPALAFGELSPDGPASVGADDPRNTQVPTPTAAATATPTMTNALRDPTGGDGGVLTCASAIRAAVGNA